ncbi:MAG: alpha/beta fold hydrolase [Rhodospirillaceae bacterium]|nr:alpha/beta fold hydrolase [Rhodospirillaceae bacterium]MBT4749565.1 alpha/beta fold hydrolase [Rhodospirillaceae bacterium]
MDERITFDWDGIEIAGILDIPDASNGPIPAFVILHGFGANKDSGSVPAMATLLTNRGYASLRLDMPGVGDSGGVVGRLVCLEQVAVARRGIDYLESRAEIDSARIGVAGASFGAAVSIYTGGADERVAAIISSGGWGNGARKAKLQHPPPAAYDKFITMVEEGRKKVAAGETMMVPRFDIVPIPEHLRGNLDITSLMEFHVETAIGIFDFRPEDMVGKISPRPLLLLHPTNDSVTPVSETMELFAKAGENTDVHLLADVDHFMFSEENVRVTHVIGDWLDKFFPLDAAAVKDAAE